MNLHRQTNRVTPLYADLRLRGHKIMYHQDWLYLFKVYIQLSHKDSILLFIFTYQKSFMSINMSNLFSV